MRLVLIEWLDSYGCSANWQGLDDPVTEPMRCKSVGWLIHNGPECKVVVPHMSEPGHAISPQGCGDMTIPNCAVLKVTNLSASKRKP